MWVHQLIRGEFVKTWDQDLCNKHLDRELVSAEDVLDLCVRDPRDPVCGFGTPEREQLDLDYGHNEPSGCWYDNDNCYTTGKVQNQDDLSKGETYQYGEWQEEKYSRGEYPCYGLFTFEGNENVR